MWGMEAFPPIASLNSFVSSLSGSLRVLMLAGPTSRSDAVFSEALV